jgi:uncharacterized protein YbjT (DUF2867 family)
VSATVRILILGGTAFVGRAIVEDALRGEAEVTLFGRSKTPAQERALVGHPPDQP